jgi:hypothetical protein
MTITLKEFLFDLEFDYQVNDDNTISLVDLMQANLGNIEEEKFEIWEQLPMVLVDRLDTYINDYHIEGIIDTLRHDCQYKDDVYPYDEKLISAMKQYPTQFDDSLIDYIEDIITANIDISELKL